MVVISGGQLDSPKVHHLEFQAVQRLRHLLFQNESPVVCGNSNSHHVSP